MSKRIEQVIVDKVRKILCDNKYPLSATKEDKNKLIVYEQDSYKTNVELSKLLAHASKCSKKTESNLWTSNAEFGKPEFVIINTEDNLAIVIECKVNIEKKHIGKTLKEKNILDKKYNSISGNAVEGALHYAKFLSENYDVMAIGVTGNIIDEDKISNLKIDTFAWEQGKVWEEEKAGPFVNLKIDRFMSYVDYTMAFKKLNIIKKNQIETNALLIAKELNDTLHDASVPPIERSLLVSGLLLVLRDEVFINTYRNRKIDDKKLLKLLDTSIDDILKELEVKDSFKKEMLKTKFKDVFNQPGLLKDNARILRDVLRTLEESVAPCMTGEFSLDIVGKFYSEFLRYAKGDKSSGIVLTPPHITELFCDLINLNIDDVILDPCAGTAGFLIAGMNRLYSLAEKLPDSESRKEHIRRYQLFGCDDEKQMFALGTSNMILRGDGKANMYFGSCFDHKAELENIATVGMINPPYSGTDISCIEFLDFLCNCIRSKDDSGNFKGKNRSSGDNLVCAIIPTAYMNSNDWKHQRKKLLENNTLLAVMSMPVDLFRPVNTITCIVLLKAGTPHDPGVPTYLGNWKDDGYVWKKGTGRVPDKDRHEDIKDRWLKSFKRTIDDEKIGFWRCLDGEDECCWERYAKTDYSEITKELFELEVKNFMLYKLREMSLSELNEDDEESFDEIAQEESN